MVVKLFILRGGNFAKTEGRKRILTLKQRLHRTTARKNSQNWMGKSIQLNNAKTILQNFFFVLEVELVFSAVGEMNLAWRPFTSVLWAVTQSTIWNSSFTLQHESTTKAEVTALLSCGLQVWCSSFVSSLVERFLCVRATVILRVLLWNLQKKIQRDVFSLSKMGGKVNWHFQL